MSFVHTVRRVAFEIAVITCAFAFLACCMAQTVRPVVVEYRATAKGKFELVNDGLEPLTVILQPVSFVINEDGDPTFGKLNPAIHLKLSAMSLRIPPLQKRFVFYEASSDVLPAWFTIYSTISGHQQSRGFNIEIDLPHTVYLSQKERLEKSEVEVESARYIESTHRVAICVINTSAKLGRVLGWEISAKGKTFDSSGFPLLPGSRRRLEIAWESPSVPDKLSLQFDHFVIKHEINLQRNN